MNGSRYRSRRGRRPAWAIALSFFLGLGCAAPRSPAPRAAAGSATAGDPSGEEVSLTPRALVPARPAARTYEAALPAARADGDPDPLRERLRAGIVRAVEGAGVPPPASDPRLDRVADDLVRARGREGQDFEVVRFLLGHYGVVLPEPSLYYFRTSAGAEEAGFQRIMPSLRELVRPGSTMRFGIGISRRGETTAVALAIQEQGLVLEPVPRRLPPLGTARLRGSLLGFRRQMEVAVANPRGVVRRVPHRLSGQRFEATFACSEGDGRYQVEVLAIADRGPEVAANFPIFCGVAPPRDVIYTPTPPNQKEGGDPRTLEREMFALVNQDRAAAGLGALAWSDKLAQVARGHSAEMSRTGQVAHVSRTTGTVEDRLAQVGLRRLPLIAENVGLAGSVPQSQRGFMTSPGHRANVLHPQLSHVGIGIAVARGELGDVNLYVTQVYALGL
jgi:uncharacterized protein YkwD